VTRAAVYGSAAWRRWKHDHHWAASAQSDPLGTGNTALISSLGVTPIFFYDVRKNLTLSGSNVSSLKDVKGDGTYGPSLTPPGTAPTWDGVTITTTGGILISSSTITGLDLSAQLTVAMIADAGGSAGTDFWQIGPTAAGTPNWRGQVKTGNLFLTSTSTNTVGATSAASTGTGNLRLLIFTLNVVATDAVSIEVPSTAKVSSATAAALTSANYLLALGGTTANSARATTRWRAALGWTGGYTPGQASTLLTYAVNFHGAVAA